MSNFSFSNFNKERVFSFDTSNIAGNYKSLEELYRENGDGHLYQLKGVYISTKSDYNDESPIAALADCYVNLPQHQLADVKAMLNDKGAVSAINKGCAGFEIRSYTKNLKTKNGKVTPKVCFSAEWCDVNPFDFEDEVPVEE